MDQINEEKQNLKDQKIPLKKILNQGIHILPNINKYYESATGETKQRIVGSIFNGKIGIENKKVRTANLNPILNEIASINKGLRDKTKKDLTKKIVKSSMVIAEGFEPSTLGLRVPCSTN